MGSFGGGGSAHIVNSARRRRRPRRSRRRRHCYYSPLAHPNQAGIKHRARNGTQNHPQSITHTQSHAHA